MATLRWLSGQVVAEGLPGAAAAREAAEADPLAFGMLVGLSDDRETYPADLEVTALLKPDPAALLFAEAAGLTLAGLRNRETLDMSSMAVTEPRLALPCLQRYSVDLQETWPRELRAPALQHLDLRADVRLNACELGNLQEATPVLQTLLARGAGLHRLPPLPATLLSLDVTGNCLGSLDLEGCSRLRVVKAADNRLSAVGLGPAVETLDVGLNWLRALRAPPLLLELDARDNLLGGTLDLSHCLGLGEFCVEGNFLEEVLVPPGVAAACRSGALKVLPRVRRAHAE